MGRRCAGFSIRGSTSGRSASPRHKCWDWRSRRFSRCPPPQVRRSGTERCSDARHPRFPARNQWTAARPEGANWSAGGNRISDFSLEHGREVVIGSAPHPNRADRNLCFDGLNILARVQSEGKQLDFIFDTGNGAGTQLWERFSNDFATIVKERSVRESKRVTRIGGSNYREATVLPEIHLRVGGFEASLQPANIFARPVGNEFQHGNLGMDLLSQAHSVSVDFKAMSLVLQ